jgi:hypothetical protein
MAAHQEDAATSLRDMFLADHRRIEETLTRVIVALEALDPERAAAEWLDFDDALTRHLDAEDRYLVVALSVSRPRDARTLLQEHRHLRSRALELGRAVERGVSLPGAIRGFVDELSAHVRHETSVLYEWAEDEIDAADRDAVLRAIIPTSRPLSGRGK